MNHLASALRRLVVSGSLSRAELEKWRDEAIQKIAANSGQTIVTASAHGISFTAAGRMNWDSWFGLLDTVLQSIDRNTKLSGRATASF